MLLRHLCAFVTRIGTVLFFCFIYIFLERFIAEKVCTARSSTSYRIVPLTSVNKYLYNVNEQRNILHEIRKRKANWIGHILRRNCLLQVIEGKIKGQIEVTRRRGRRCNKLLDDLKDRRGYCQLKEEALDRSMWRNRFGRGFGPVV